MRLLISKSLSLSCDHDMVLDFRLPTELINIQSLIL